MACRQPPLAARLVGTSPVPPLLVRQVRSLVSHSGQGRCRL